MNNIGSIIKIEIIEASKITVSKPDTDNKVTITTDGEFDVIKHQQESPGFNEVEKQVIEGVVYQSELTFKVPKIDPDTISVLNNYINKPAVIRLTDGNSRTYIMGSDTVPLYILRQSIIPAKAAGLNSYAFSVKYKNPRPVPFCG